MLTTIFATAAVLRENQEKTALTEQEITQLIIQLENENKLQLTNKQTTVPSTAKANLLSQNAAWYWITIALAIATAIAVFTIPEDAYPIVYVRQVLGIIFVLFLPGYTFIKTLFPSKLPIQTSSENMDNIERTALSLGMSLALTSMVGLVLNYSPWGITLTPITLSLLGLTVVFASAALIREHQAKTTLPDLQT